jgi:transposase-like protein
MRSRRHLPVRPAPRSAFSGYRFPPEVITLAVRWYLRFGLSYRDVEELLAERGVEVDHVSVYRWVQRFAPEFAEAARARQHIIGDRWHVDETYLKVDGSWRYLFRAIDQFGQVIDVYLSPRRDAKAARRFFERAIGRTRVSPVEVTTDRYRVYPRVLDGCCRRPSTTQRPTRTTSWRPTMGASRLAFDRCEGLRQTAPRVSLSPAMPSSRTSAGASTTSGPTFRQTPASLPRSPSWLS